MNAESRVAILYADSSISVFERDISDEKAIDFFNDEDPNETDVQKRPKLVRLSIEIEEIIIDPITPTISLASPKCPHCGKTIEVLP